MIRVLVVEDSATVRHRLVAALSADPELSVVAETDNGQAAVEFCRELRPDVVTIDMMLPVMNGLEATRRIMERTPTPILIVSASTNRGELFRTYEALAAGAVDVLEKPLGIGDDAAWDGRLVKLVKLVSRIRVIRRFPDRERREAVPPEAARALGSAACRAVAMGASTGGPAAVRSVLRSLPRGFPVPILLVIHIGKAFGAALADWLDGQSPLRAAYAEDGEPLPAVGDGRVVVAPPDRHLVVRNGRLRLTGSQERNFCRPSVDELFESVARELGPRGAGCVLTGMGRDGADGLLAIRRAGGPTFAQDEATSIVYGMPRAAVEIGAARSVLPLGEFGAALGALAPATPIGGAS